LLFNREAVSRKSRRRYELFG